MQNYLNNTGTDFFTRLKFANMLCLKKWSEGKYYASNWGFNARKDL
jgi:hypothetical protein